MSWIINRYILKNLIPPFLLSLLIFTFIFFVTRILALTEMVVNRGMGFADVLKLFVYASPYFFMFTVPMSVLFAVVLTFVRLSGDNEITALKAAGINPLRLLPPVVVLAIFGFALTFVTSVFLVPRANLALADHLFRIASSRADVIITERLFIDDFEGLVLYIESVDPKTRLLKRIFVSDERDPEYSAVITADEGILLRDPGRKVIVLRLFKGAIDQLSRDEKETQTIRFATYDLKVDLKKLATQRRADRRHRDEYKQLDLLKKMAEHPPGSTEYNFFAVIYYERLAVPFACLCLGIMGVPLALQSHSKKRTGGLVLALTAFLSYYLFYTVVRGLGDNGQLAPSIGLWLPNIVFAFLTVYLLFLSVRERQSFIFVQAGRLAGILARLRKR